jgi:hypothetical protein
VHNAEWYPRRRERSIDRVREALEPIDTGNQNILHATVLQLVKDIEPKLRAFIL